MSVPGARWSVRPAGLGIIVAVLLAVPVSGVAQGQMPGRRGRAELEQRIRARFGQMVKERLGLTDEQSKRLGEVVQGFQDDRMQLARNEAAVRRRVRALLLETDPSDQEALDLMRQMASLREQEARLSAQEEDSLLTVLSPSQLLRFDVLREEMGQRIRQLRRGQGPAGRGPLGGGGLPGGDGPPDGTSRAPWGFF